MDIQKVLLLDVAALSYSIAQDETLVPAIHRVAQRGFMAPLRPSFPCLTSTVQASLTTGTPPSAHGIIANGFYDREKLKICFWEQSDRLVCARRIWNMAKEKCPGFSSAILFWQNSIGSNNDIILTPRPVHKHSGGIIDYCYSHPPDLYPYLVRQLGQFKLRWYWGPFTSAKGSRWITRATIAVMRQYTPHLVLSYLPLLDYSLQREGPEGPSVPRDLACINDCISELLNATDELGYHMIIVGDYAIQPVDQALFPNRILRQEGLLVPYVVAGREYMDHAKSKAFAMVDHQIAHVYCHPAIADRVRRIFSNHPGIETVLGSEEMPDWGVNHGRSGELILIAAKGTWFAYPWWQTSRARPDFATHVDIHNKPGYDPLELFWDVHPFRISQNTARIRGSHGRPSASRDTLGTLAMTFTHPYKQHSWQDTDILELLMHEVWRL